MARTIKAAMLYKGLRFKDDSGQILTVAGKPMITMDGTVRAYVYIDGKEGMYELEDCKDSDDLELA